MGVPGAETSLSPGVPSRQPGRGLAKGRAFGLNRSAQIPGWNQIHAPYESAAGEGQEVRRYDHQYGTEDGYSGLLCRVVCEPAERGICLRSQSLRPESGQPVPPRSVRRRRHRLLYQESRPDVSAHGSSRSHPMGAISSRTSRTSTGCWTTSKGCPTRLAPVPSAGALIRSSFRRGIPLITISGRLTGSLPRLTGTQKPQ